MDDAWTREIDDIAREFNVNLHTGLTESQVQQNLAQYGKNGTYYLNSFRDSSLRVLWFVVVFLSVELVLILCSATRRSTNPVMATCPGTVQRSVGDYITWFGIHFICIGTCGGCK